MNEMNNCNQLMSKRIHAFVALACAGLFAAGSVQAQTVLGDADVARVQAVVSKNVPLNMGIGTVRASSVVMSGDTVTVDLSENFSDIPFTESSISKMKDDVKTALGPQGEGRKVKLTVAGVDVDDYFIDFDSSYKRKHAPFVTPVDKDRHYSKALDGNIVAMWPSHGLYFENKLNRWEWQRGRLMQTVEDMYTHSYVIPFLMPMLENAGAYVWDARERDTHKVAVVVDNDGGKASSAYGEQNGKCSWTKGNGTGFAYVRDQYVDSQNPFAEGTYRQVATTKDKKKLSLAHWDVDMPEAGDYAVYVSYKTVPGSSTDARYTVNSLAGPEEFVVDQTMAGGVWVYLGTFQLKKGLNKNVVTLSNFSKEENRVVTADAIKVGGGTNMVARRVALPTDENKQLAAQQENEKSLGKPGIDYKYVSSSNYPLFEVGSRYYLQWAGFPDSVYSPTRGINDYTDDYRCRGMWVNYLAGGSAVLPARKGLNVPVDVSFCLHTDAGTTPGDDIIGTLIIYCTKQNGKQFSNYVDGTPRELSRKFANIVTSQVVNDIRAKYEPNWTRRGMRDASYFEARVPEVPALLMELLSHQNFADMKYGLDPNFRFDVSRAIYKGILKFIAQRDHRDYVVQPLPVNSFAIDRVSDDCYILNWKPTPDSLSENADPKKYVVYERVADGGFKQLAVTKDTKYVTYVKDNLVHSYKVVAMNDGGRSFPSEVLSLGVAKGSKGNVAVVNGFTRLSAPDWFDGDKMAGFLDEKDHGVDYVRQINYVGKQYEFDRSLEWKDDDDTGFGDSRSDHETEPVAGNTFDYTAIHGQSLLNAGYSFVSMSAQAFAAGKVNNEDFKTVDIILGKQKETPNGRGAYPDRYKIFTPELMQAIKRFTSAGGNVLMSGSYVGSDVWNNAKAGDAEKTFASSVLGYKLRASRACDKGQVMTVPTSFGALVDGRQATFVQQLNSKMYAVESPDALMPADDRGQTYMRYGENNKPAAVAVDCGTYRTVVMGFPLETVVEPGLRDAIVGDVMRFLNKQ